MKKILLTSILAVSMFSAHAEEVLKSKPVAKAACWRFGLDRTGAHNTKGVPVKTGEKWRAKIGGKVISSPVLYDGIIYVGSDKGFFALEAETGKEVWKKTDFKAIKKSDYRGVESSACIADGFVYFSAIDGFLYSLDAKTGEVRWKTVPKGMWNKAVVYSPGVAYGLVFSMGGKGLAGFDIETGKEVWKSDTFCMPPTVGVTMTDKYIVGLSSAGDGCSANYISTGLTHAKSEFHTSFGYSRSTPAVVGDRIYGSTAALIGTAPRYPRVAIFNLKIKRVEANNFVEPHKEKSDMKVVFSSTTVWGGKVFVGCDSGHLYAFDDKKLKPAWNFKTGGPVRASASVSKQDGILYIPSYDGKIYALDANTGEKKWEHKISSPTKEPSQANSCPWVEDGVVYIGTFDGDIVAIH